MSSQLPIVHENTRSLCRDSAIPDSYLRHLERLLKIRQWMREGKVALPPPSQVIIFPTYECSKAKESASNERLCSHCAYARSLGPIHLDPDVVQRAASDSVAMGVRNIQIAGGGEPLQYVHLEALFTTLLFLKERHPDLVLGLLSNGLYLTPALAEESARLFTYVRISFAEGCIADDDLGAMFIDRFRMFLQRALSKHQLRVGLKMLVSHENAGYLPEQINRLAEGLGPTLFKRINHIRIKAMRSRDSSREPSERDKTRFQNGLEAIMARHRGSWPKDSSVDLDLGYVHSSFQCEVTPFFAVVDPHGKLMGCYNYLETPEALLIGDLSSARLVELWGGERHREVVALLKTELVCNSREGCPCRYLQYQREMDALLEGKVSAINPETATRLSFDSN